MPKGVALDIVMMKGILLIYIISTQSVTFAFSSIIPSGRLSSVFSITLESVLRVVFPFRGPRFGPSMYSALNMSAFEIRQFGRRRLST